MKSQTYPTLRYSPALGGCLDQRWHLACPWQRGFRDWFVRAILGILIVSSGTSMAAETRVTENLTPAIFAGDSGGVHVSWEVKRLVPAPGPVLFATYRLEQSLDLVQWSEVGGDRPGTNKTRIDVEMGANTPVGFFRVQRTVAAPQATFQAAQLDRADFAGADLREADLSRARLRGADLRAADLFGAQAFKADFGGATLNWARLAAADLRESTFDAAALVLTDLTMARLEKASFEDADLRAANLRFADFTDANLFGADLRKSDLRFTILSGADTRFVQFQGSVIDELTLLDEPARTIWELVNIGAKGGSFTNLNLGFARFDRAELQGGQFNGSDFTASDLSDADLRGANFTGANLRFVFFHGAKLDDTTILAGKPRLIWELVNGKGSGRDLQRADLSSSILSDTNLNDADLRLANLSTSNFHRTTLRRANLTGANLSNANLTQVDLTGANLTGAILTGVTFDRTIMPDGSIRQP